VGAFPAGGLVFTTGARGEAPDFANYSFGASLGWNATRRVGVEGEAGFGIGGRQTITFGDETLPLQAMPDTITYSGNLVLHFDALNRIVPYATGGLGAFSIVRREGAENLGIIGRQTLLTGNCGGGLKWYSRRDWGIRADYRLLMVHAADNTTAFFGQNTTRYAHRVYAGIFATF
jgi:outer membrane protein with beta-barrel domain